MLKLQSGWIWTVKRCGRSWRNSRRPETSLTDQGVEENGVSAPLNSSKTRGKSCDETLAAAADPWPPQPLWANHSCIRCWGMIWWWSPLRCCIGRSLRPIMSPWGPKNAEKSSRKWPTARCRASCSLTRRNRYPAGGKPAKWPSLGSLFIHSGKYRHQTSKLAACHGLYSRHRDRGGSSLLLCPLESNWTPSATSPTFWRVACCPGPRSTSKDFLVPATGLCTLSHFQDRPVIDSEKNPLIHKQGSLACMEPWP